MATSVQENHSATTVGSSGAGTSSAAHVNFVCQRCLQPLKLDRSFTTIDPYLFAELSTPLTKPAEKEEPVVFFQKDKEVTITEDENVIHKLVPPSRYALDENSQDFTLLGEAGSGSMESLSHRVKIYFSRVASAPNVGKTVTPEQSHAKNNEIVTDEGSMQTQVTSFLFDFLSGQSEVDHPLCEECTDSLLDQLDHQLNITETECKDYRDFLEKLGSNSEKVDEKELDSELKHLQAEEDALQKQLEVVENERAQMAELVQKEKKTEKQLDEEEERYWKEYNEQKRQLLQLEDEQRSVDNKLKYAQTQLDKLRKTNVFNSTFHIWHSGHFGTINNFRLGRLPSVPVDWNEINAAWGQTVLLLNSLARKMNLKFQRYRLVPYGNHSYIESLTDKSKELPLYGSGGFRFFWDTKFDQAMVAFLDCLQQFKEEVEKGDSSFCLPYKMEKGKIEDTGSGASYSIKIQFNSEEQWTKALKFMLTNLKWGLAWVSSQFADK